jgi:hypothetical protein
VLPRVRTLRRSRADAAGAWTSARHQGGDAKANYQFARNDVCYSLVPVSEAGVVKALLAAPTDRRLERCKVPNEGSSRQPSRGASGRLRFPRWGRPKIPRGPEMTVHRG